MKRFWIGAGSLVVFVVGVSLIAYATGKYTSEASTISDVANTATKIGQDVSAPATGAVGAADTATVGSQNVSAPTPGAIGTGTANGASDAAATTPSGGKTTLPGDLKGGTLAAIKPAPAITLDNLLTDGFASFDQILKVGIPNLLISLAGVVTLVVFLINATKFLFGAGTEEVTKEAKQGMAFAAIGMAIVVFAYIAVKFASGIFN